MRTTRENILHHVGTIHVHDISNELQNKNNLTITKPEHTQAVMDEHEVATKGRDQSYQHLE